MKFKRKKLFFLFSKRHGGREPPNDSWMVAAAPSMPRGKVCRPPTDQLTRSTNHAHSLTHTGKTSENGGGSHSYCSQRNMPCQRKDHCSIQTESDRKGTLSAVLSNGNCLFLEFHSILLWNTGRETDGQADQRRARNGFHPAFN